MVTFLTTLRPVARTEFSEFTCYNQSCIYGPTFSFAYDSRPPRYTDCLYSYIHEKRGLCKFPEKK